MPLWSRTHHRPYRRGMFYFENSSHIPPAGKYLIRQSNYCTLHYNAAINVGQIGCFVCHVTQLHAKTVKAIQTLAGAANLVNTYPSRQYGVLNLITCTSTHSLSIQQLLFDITLYPRQTRCSSPCRTLCSDVS